MKVMSKNEILEWIDFLYGNLKNSFIVIQGYNFTLDQLSEIKSIKTRLESEIINVQDTINTKHEVVTKPSLNWQTMRLKQENKRVKSKKLKPIKLKVLNKHHQDVELKVEFGQLCYVYRTLEYMKDEIEYFKTFLKQEINNIEEKDRNSFFLFVNDLFSDVLARIRGEIE